VKPELNDEFANKIGGFKTLQELRDDVESGLIERESQSSKEELKDALAEKLGNEAKMETPEMLVEDNIQTGLQNARQQAEQNGKNFEDFIKESGFKDEAELINKEARPQAERQVKISLALRKLAEVQKLEVSKEELQQYTMTLMQQYGNPEAQKQIMSEQEQARIEGRLLADKVLDYLVAQVS
jgi:trigger factor